jgi:putative transposase
MDDRKAFEAIMYVLRTGIQWNALPREVGASSTVHDRFQAWERAGFFKAVWQEGLSEYDDLVWHPVGMASGRRSDAASAPFAGAATAANPTDRGKSGTNPHDVRLLSATLDGLVISRPEPTPEQPQHLCLDAAYDSTPVYQELLARHYQPHVRSRGEEKREKEFIPGYRARRWVVERTHSWLNRSRRLLVRWEKKVENYLAFLHLACAQLIFAKLLVFG